MSDRAVRVVKQTVNDKTYSTRPAWCLEHRDLARLWGDGSVECWWACVVEAGTEECRVEPIGLLVSPEVLASIRSKS